MSQPDAIVVGAGPNGLVAANLLVDAGWDVLVVEAEPEPGGAVRSAEVCAPGFSTDLFSSFYPLGVSSPVLARLDLAAHGLRWSHAPTVLAHPLLDGRTAVLSRDLATTCASLEGFAPGDGEAWAALTRRWQELSPALLASLFTPFPPVRGGLRLARALGPGGLLRFARFGLTPVSRFAAETFRGEGGGLLLAGNALHTDLTADAPGSALFGWLLAMLGQQVGFPVPVGGAGALTDALVARLRAGGGQLRCEARVERIEVHGGRATGVVLAGGERLTARRAIVADVTAPPLLLGLVGEEHLPAGLVADLQRFEWDDATIKLNWALSGPIPWANPEVHGAGTVHLGGDLAELGRFGRALAAGRVPDDPFLLVGQMTTADPSRSPAGTESAWAYTHVPRGSTGDSGEDRERAVARIEARMEAYAPGFGRLVLGRHVQLPQDLEARNANLVGGAINGGSAALHQQLVLRPTPGLGRPETPIAGLLLASSSAHPGGGVHGACGANAAKAALRAQGAGRVALALTRRLAR